MLQNQGIIKQIQNMESKKEIFDNVHGSTMFFNNMNFKKKVKPFDENIFLYWEEIIIPREQKKWL